MALGSWIRNCSPPGSHETMCSKFLLGASSSISYSFVGNCETKVDDDDDDWTMIDCRSVNTKKNDLVQRSLEICVNSKRGRNTNRA